MNAARTEEMRRTLEAARTLPLAQRLDVIAREFKRYSADVDEHARQVDAFLERARKDAA
jgi:hypothetical protein